MLKYVHNSNSEYQLQTGDVCLLFTKSFRLGCLNMYIHRYYFRVQNFSLQGNTRISPTKLIPFHLLVRRLHRDRSRLVWPKKQYPLSKHPQLCEVLWPLYPLPISLTVYARIELASSSQQVKSEVRILQRQY